MSTPLQLLEQALPYVAEAAQGDTHYGHPASDDPRDFHPDPECSTEEEREAHRLACAAWDRGERPDFPRSSWDELVLGDGTKSTVHVNRQPFGLGTTTIRNPEAEALLTQIRLALLDGVR